MNEQRGSTVYTPLRRRGDFHRVHAQGQRKGDTLLQVRALPTPPRTTRTTPIRLGILVSKKYGGAVERNRFKRVVRAALRALAEELQPGWDVLVLPRESREAKMPEIRDSLRHLLRELGVLRAADARSAEGD
jgi:ribonuclease P protein component